MMILNHITAITIVITILITINFIAYMIVDSKETLNSSEARNVLKSTIYVDAFILVVYIFCVMILGIRLI